MKNYYKFSFCFFVSFLLLSCASRKSVVFINSPSIERSQKEALLILPGFGSQIFGTTKMKEYFTKKGYDVYIPNYIGRKSIDQCLATLEKFFQKNKLSEYKKINVFSYMLGAWTLNKYIALHPTNNIASIVYDRGPVQERVSKAMTKDVPFLIRIAAGKILWDFKNTPYPSLPKGNIKVGIMIECKASKLARKHKKTILTYGPFDWDVKQLKQEYDDYLYTWVNHDEMYSRFDIFGDELLHFFNNGKFTDKALKEPLAGDPFEIYKE